MNSWIETLTEQVTQKQNRKAAIHEKLDDFFLQLTQQIENDLSEINAKIYKNDIVLKLEKQRNFFYAVKSELVDDPAVLEYNFRSLQLYIRAPRTVRIKLDTYIEQNKLIFFDGNAPVDVSEISKKLIEPLVREDFYI